MPSSDKDSNSIELNKEWISIKEIALMIKYIIVTTTHSSSSNIGMQKKWEISPMQAWISIRSFRLHINRGKGLFLTQVSLFLKLCRRMMRYMQGKVSNTKLNIFLKEEWNSKISLKKRKRIIIWRTDTRILRNIKILEDHLIEYLWFIIYKSILLFIGKYRIMIGYGKFIDMLNKLSDPFFEIEFIRKNNSKKP